MDCTALSSMLDRSVAVRGAVEVMAVFSDESHSGSFGAAEVLETNVGVWGMKRLWGKLAEDREKSMGVDMISPLDWDLARSWFEC